MSRWTDDSIERLKRRWKDGDSAGDIARAFGMTRNAVIGKLARLGLLGERKTPSRPVKAKAVDPQKHIDARDLQILDALVKGASTVETARAFGVAPSYVGELWAAREACA